MRNPLRWTITQTKVRPFFSVLVILLVVITPGYFRLEDTIKHNRETSAELVKVTKIQTDQAKTIAIGNCQIRNTAQKNTRDRFTQLFDGLDVILAGNPDESPTQQQAAHAFIDSLRKAVPLNPSAEDVDCNRDGQLTTADYG